MKTNSRLLIFLIVIAGVLVTLYYWFVVKPEQMQPHRSIIVVLKQLAENNLQLKEVKVETIYPAEPFHSSRLEKYYQAKVLSQNNKVLYTTQIPKVYLVSRFTYPEYQAVPPVTQNNTDIDLYLPVYPISDKVVIEDEAGNTIMSINLKNVVSD